jgi:hypothetical protein
MPADLDLPDRPTTPAENAGDAAVQDSAAAQPQITAPPLLYRWAALAGMAAGLILGVVLASSFGIGSDIRSSGGSLFAQGALGEALSRDLSGGGSAVGPSFWSKDGEFCRAFTRRAPKSNGYAGIACREAGAWRIRVVSQADASGNSQLPASIRGVMDNLIAGMPLDRAAEQQAQRQGWRTR